MRAPSDHFVFLQIVTKILNGLFHSGLDLPVGVCACGFVSGCVGVCEGSAEAVFKVNAQCAKGKVPRRTKHKPGCGALTTKRQRRAASPNPTRTKAEENGEDKTLTAPNRVAGATMNSTNAGTNDETTRDRSEYATDLDTAHWTGLLSRLHKLDRRYPRQRREPSVQPNPSKHKHDTHCFLHIMPCVGELVTQPLVTVCKRWTQAHAQGKRRHGGRCRSDERAGRERLEQQTDEQSVGSAQRWLQSRSGTAKKQQAPKYLRDHRTRHSPEGVSKIRRMGMRKTPQEELHVQSRVPTVPRTTCLDTKKAKEQAKASKRHQVQMCRHNGRTRKSQRGPKRRTSTRWRAVFSTEERGEGKEETSQRKSEGRRQRRAGTHGAQHRNALMTNPWTKKKTECLGTAQKAIWDAGHDQLAK